MPLQDAPGDLQCRHVHAELALNSEFFQQSGVKDGKQFINSLHKEWLLSSLVHWTLIELLYKAAVYKGSEQLQEEALEGINRENLIFDIILILIFFSILQGRIDYDI